MYFHFPPYISRPLCLYTGLFIIKCVFISLDATLVERMGKYVNDSPKSKANAVMTIVTVNNTPKLCLMAQKDIQPGTEIRYDYNAPNLWWQKKVFEDFVG